MNLLKGFADDLPLMTWLHEHIWPMESRLVDADFVYHGSRLALAESLLGGVTTVNDMYFFPERVADACRDVGIRGNARHDHRRFSQCLGRQRRAALRAWPGAARSLP